jgi:hypothetical protein
MPSVRAEDQLTIGDRVRFLPSYKPGIQFVREAERVDPPAGA